MSSDTDPVQDQTPSTEPADATRDARRFKIYDADGTTVRAHGVIFPPPTCYITVVWQSDGRLEQHTNLQSLLDDHGDDLVFVDKTRHGPETEPGTFS